jgi:putative acetyltransferase
MSATGHPIVVRRGEPSDADALHALFMGAKATAGTLQVPYPSVDEWRHRLTNYPAQDYLLVATIDSELVGHVALHAMAKSPRRRHLAGVAMAVRDDRHGRGIGSALMRAAIELADGWLNYRRLELTVYTDNLAALALYRKFGFAIEGTCLAYAFRDGCYVDAYLMARIHPPIESAAND